jgi:hypothetical protein
MPDAAALFLVLSRMSSFGAATLKSVLLPDWGRGVCADIDREQAKKENTAVLVALLESVEILMMSSEAIDIHQL